MLGWSKKCDRQDKAASSYGVARSNEKIDLSYGDHSVPIPLNEVKIDSGEFFAADGKVHIKQDGIYMVTGQVGFDYQKSAIGTRWAGIRKNGDTNDIYQTSTSPNSTTYTCAVTIADIFNLAANDYLELMAGVSSDGTASTTKTLSGKLSIARIGN